MFRSPATATAVGRARAQKIRTRSVPAPVGGLNARDSIGAMDEKDAVILKNFWPLPSKVMLRRGSNLWVSGIGAQVESLMGYAPKTGTAALFAAASTKIYNVTRPGTVGAAVLIRVTVAPMGALAGRRTESAAVATVVTSDRPNPATVALA